ncbi:MAG: UDP-2,3-diacylglucosamine diphosphatase [Pseudomonadales bacterium]|nr:UDP-2,3-diacylglucosamine diphosphatase [Pseudomonadales bacterium]
MFSDKTHYRSIFISDTHLGTRGCQAERLAGFLKAHTCDQLYLVGDIVDGWRLKSGFYWPQEHNNVMRRILTAAKRDTEVIYVTGNHDEFLRRYADMQLGSLRIVNRAIHTTADGRQMLVIHGDEYDVVTRYHRWIAFLGDMGYTLLLNCNGLVNWARRRLGYGYWSLSAWLKYKVKRAVSYIGEFEQALARQCRQERFDGVICGHIHHAEIRQVDGIEYLNCGDWVESCTAVVEDRLGRFSIVRWTEDVPSAEIVPLRQARRA